MPEKIQDGKGRGYIAAVNTENRLSVESVSVSLEHHVNVTHEDAYNFLFTVTPSAGGCFLYCKNNSNNKLILEGIAVRTDGQEKLEIYMDAIGTPIGGASIAPANLNAGTNNVAVGDFQTGTNITGLANGTLGWRHYFPGKYETDILNFDADIIVPKNHSISIYATNGSVLIDGFLIMAYRQI